MDNLLRECRVCNKEFDYCFDYEFRAYHKHEEQFTMYDFSKGDICSKYCIASFAQLLMGEEGHAKDTFVAIYSIPIGFCDKCGDATHPTEFCELLGDVSEKDVKYHDDHLSGQGGMVQLGGKVCEVFLGQDWTIKTSGVEFRNDLVQLEPDLKLRAPLALVWDDVEQYSILAESICVPDSRHEERKRFVTAVEIVPVSGDVDQRYYYVFQIVEKVSPVQKIFFPYFLHSVNCWFPVDACEIRSFERYFRSFQKSDYIYRDVNQVEYDTIFVKEVEDVDANYEAFMKGLELLQTKQDVHKELQSMTLEKMEQMSLENVYEGEGRSLVDRDEDDNVITEEDIAFLESRGFQREEIENFILPGRDLDQVMDDAFIEQMKCNETRDEEEP
jgi:hypothetical protein